MAFDGRASGKPSGALTPVALSAAYGGSVTVSLTEVLSIATLWVAIGAKAGAAPAAIADLGGDVSSGQMITLQPKLSAHYDGGSASWVVAFTVPISAADFSAGDAVYVLLFNGASEAPADSDAADLVLGPLMVGA